jgi:hypothetical protein
MLILRSDNKAKRFIVVMRGPAATVFREHQSLLIQSWQSAVGPVDITFTTRWLNKGDNV